jgi:hypothetical protein
VVAVAGSVPAFTLSGATIQACADGAIVARPAVCTTTFTSHAVAVTTAVVCALLCNAFRFTSLSWSLLNQILFYIILSVYVILFGKFVHNFLGRGIAIRTTSRSHTSFD